MHVAGTARRAIENVYFHLPFCLKKCVYCSFPMHAVGINAATQQHFDDMQAVYIQNVLAEMTSTFEVLRQTEQSSNRHRHLPSLRSVYFGGGTPSLIHPRFLHSLLDNLTKHGFNITQDTEITLECDPGTFNAEKLKDYQQLGVNRISLGIQSFNGAILKSMNRAQSAEDNISAIRILKESQRFGSLNNVSFDLIMNKPSLTGASPDTTTSTVPDSSSSQSPSYQAWLDDLSTALHYKPGHLSIYSMAIEPSSVLYDLKNMREGQYPLPTNEQAARTYIATHEILTANGYDHYEVSNYLKKFADKSQQQMHYPKHSPVYWLGDRDFFAFGMGASSLLQGYRLNRPATLKKYYDYVKNLRESCEKNLIEDVLKAGECETEEQTRLQAVLLGRLRTKEGLDLKYVQEVFGEQVKKDIEYAAGKMQIQMRQHKEYEGKQQEQIDQVDFEKQSHSPTSHLPQQEYIFLNESTLSLLAPEGFLMVDEVVAEISAYTDAQRAKREKQCQKQP